MMIYFVLPIDIRRLEPIIVENIHHIIKEEGFQRRREFFAVQRDADIVVESLGGLIDILKTFVDKSQCTTVQAMFFHHFIEFGSV